MRILGPGGPIIGLNSRDRCPCCPPGRHTSSFFPPVLPPFPPCHDHHLPGLRLLVPAYWFPTTTSTSSCSHPDYLRLARAGARVAAIANPYNGPVSPDTTSALYSPDFPKHHACIQALYDAGAVRAVARLAGQVTRCWGT